MDKIVLSCISNGKIFNFFNIVDMHFFDEKLDVVFDNGNQSICLYFEDYTQIRIERY